VVTTPSLDSYREAETFVHRLDPRVKFLAVLAFIVGVAVTRPPAWWAYGAFFVLVAALAVASRAPAGYLLKRSLIVEPFVFFVAVFVPFFHPGAVLAQVSLGGWHVTVYREGTLIFFGIMIKAWLSILALILLSATTRLPDLLRGLERLRLPRVMVMILSFMYRYIFVLVEEVGRLRTARDSRGYGGGTHRHRLRTIGNMTGTLFIRSYERGERIYQAMLSRGYEGRIPGLRRLALSAADVVFLAGSGAVVVAVAVLGHLGVVWWTR
jgi:cobalt/nickel transport system permease protein